MKIKTLAILLPFLAPYICLADERLNERIISLRAERESRIETAITQANNEYDKSLKNLKARLSPASNEAKTIQAEIEDLAKISVIKVPPVIRLTLPLPSSGTAEVKGPRIRNEADLATFLIGTRWNVYGNEHFLDKPIAELEFTGPDSATWSGKPITWKTTSRQKIWISGNKSITFNKTYDEFIKWWIPNSNDRKSGKIITK